MIDNSLLEYVKTSLQQGLSHENITVSLLANGWQQAAINEAITLASAPEVPKAPGFVTPVAQPQPQIQEKKPLRNYPLYSPLSLLLAFVLFFGLFILANKIISDIGRNFATDITGQLLTDAFIILPFLIAAFALHYSLTEQGEKYRILSQPYYFVSGWLLIKLLFHVSSYVLSTQAVYGVYIVLILVVSVLTGVIFFGQKYLKHKE